jgi:hypothetical protein
MTSPSQWFATYLYYKAKQITSVMTNKTEDLPRPDDFTIGLEKLHCY